MSQRSKFRTSNIAVRRGRVAVVTAGLGVSLVAGAGAAFAATGDTGAQAPAPVHTATVAATVHHQADTQAKAAAHAEQVKVAKAKAVKAAAAKKAASWIDPVSHYKLTAGFDDSGSHWIHKHSGQDFAVPIGTDVHAAHTGTVVKAGPHGAGDGDAYGNAIVIKHSDGKYSQYAHLSRIEVHVGENVKTGEEIAKSGNTGNTTGPHLHFEIRNTPNYGSAINPVTFLHEMGVKV
ncbi:M23 family metallopeptidase [Streptomyces fuscigenes]|uniref:M23 family metallopeptidase n=1 Tax=Streptomyces fuscigenes TaxID=1528880 RepID=UPI001F1B5D9D|nr:M23 family metallopeptidase [Streptomyces fuscigenes]MCF3964006.1 M23 family metallopeptidase [Streptomyces fuscigenes]